MSAASPTIVPRNPVFPSLLPKPLQPHPLPLPLEGQRRFRMNAIRDRNKEMADLSDEEFSFNEMRDEVRNRGYNFLIPIGRSLTQHEEKNDADASEEEGDDDDVSEGTTPSDEPEEAGEDEDEDEDEEEHDLDADMEDLDETTVESDDMDAEDSREVDASSDM
ncbi:hypothetical protein BDY19DRAFT_961046 [Irpex rosettiformis]|uniref:Uncharacterized protein n=1 Tax=Irpex rosettiformis TaxID=378272 RepID=A0ACB8TWB2_9APHY|nr:hypothetical protein BDY19DRAFT_961046 [Irpex rosettiformis]